MELSGGADVRPEALADFQARYRRKAFPSVEAMCASGDLDAVWIATPNACHAEHAVTAARHGKHVIVEKPMAVTLDEAELMIEAAERHGVKLVQGHSKIYSPAIQKIREIVCSGRLGPLIQINTWNFNDWLQRPRLASEVDTKIGGGVCFRQGPHQVDIVRYIGGGLVRSVRAATGRADANFATEGDYTAFLEFERGARATLAFNGYGFFDIAELTWGIGEGGKRMREGDPAGKRRLAGPVDQHTKYSNPRTTEEQAIWQRSIFLRPDHRGLRARRHSAIAGGALRLYASGPRGGCLPPRRGAQRRAARAATGDRAGSPRVPGRTMGKGDP
jgi:phthalate 4,5-cis-dihydrodiol dehydrogenase